VSGPLLTACALLDELDAAEAECCPVLIDGDGADGVEACRFQHGPAGVAVEITFQNLGRALGVSEPEDRVAFGACDGLRRNGIDFVLPGDEGEDEGWVGCGVEVAMDGDAGECCEFRFEAGWGVLDDDGFSIFEVQLFEGGGHAFCISQMGGNTEGLAHPLEQA